MAASEPDNNVKLTVLGRFEELRKTHERVLDELLMDVLSVLSSTDVDVKRKTLEIAMSMTNSRNVEDSISYLKNELDKTDKSSEKVKVARQLF